MAGFPSESLAIGAMLRPSAVKALIFVSGLSLGL